MEDQLPSNIISELKALDFRINWTLLKLGYEWQQFFPRVISAASISEYAESIIETMESDYELIVRLIRPEDQWEFEQVLERLAQAEKEDQTIQQRKLRAYIVLNTLNALPSDYFRGLLELTELWVSLDLPDDGPHTIQGRYNSYTPQEYYTQEMFDVLLEKHRRWLKDEIESIKLLDRE